MIGGYLDGWWMDGCLHEWWVDEGWCRVNDGWMEVKEKEERGGHFALEMENTENNLVAASKSFVWYIFKYF